MSDVKSYASVGGGKCTVNIVLEYDGDSPSDMDVLKAVDHLLSNIPGVNDVTKGASRKDRVLAKWGAFRELG